MNKYRVAQECERAIASFDGLKDPTGKAKLQLDHARAVSDAVEALSQMKTTRLGRGFKIPMMLSRLLFRR